MDRAHRRPGAAARTAARPTRRCSATACSPISRGGRYTLDNIAPACGSCNASKCNDEVTGWLRRKRLDERAFLLRHLEIRAALALRFPTAQDGSGLPGELQPVGPVDVEPMAVAAEGE